MKRDQIIKAAESNSAKAFLNLLDSQSINYEVLDMDNIGNPNDGYLNLIVDGLELGEALLFIDGEFAGL